MVSRLLKALVADLLMLVAAYSVVMDLQWRNSFAAFKGLNASTSYLPFIRMFTMTGRSLPLESPPTLDWLQVLAAAFIVINVWYVFVTYADRRRRPTQSSEPGNP